MPEQQPNIVAAEGAAPQDSKEDLDKNNQGCFYKMTHKYGNRKSFLFCTFKLKISKRFNKFKNS